MSAQGRRDRPGDNDALEFQKARLGWPPKSWDRSPAAAPFSTANSPTVEGEQVQDLPPHGYIPLREALHRLGDAFVDGWQEDDGRGPRNLLAMVAMAHEQHDAALRGFLDRVGKRFPRVWDYSVATTFLDHRSSRRFGMEMNDADTTGEDIIRWEARAGGVAATLYFLDQVPDDFRSYLEARLLAGDVNMIWLATQAHRLADRSETTVNESVVQTSTWLARVWTDEVGPYRAFLDDRYQERDESRQRGSRAWQYLCLLAEAGIVTAIFRYRGSKTVIGGHEWFGDHAELIFERHSYPIFERVKEPLPAGSKELSYEGELYALQCTSTAPIFVHEGALAAAITSEQERRSTEGRPKALLTASIEVRAENKLRQIAEREGCVRTRTKPQYRALVESELGEMLGENAWERTWNSVTKLDKYKGLSKRGPLRQAAER